MLKAFITLLIILTCEANMLVFQTSSISTSAGTPFSITIIKQTNGAVALTGDTNTVYLYLTSGYVFGTTGVDFSGGLSSGTVSDLYITVVGTYTITATCAGFSDVSGTVTVGVGSITLVFTTQPSNGAGTANCPVTIQAKDIYGDLVTTATNSVTLSIDGSTDIFSPLTSPMVSGSVTFSSCSISGAGTLRFIASASELTSAVSNTFTVTQTLKSITLTAPTTTVYAGVACYVGITLLDTNNLSFLNTATITITKSSGTGTITTSSITTFVPPVTSSVTFSQSGTFVLTATCTGGNCGSFTVTTVSITVVANAYINILWPNHIEESSTNTYQIELLGIAPTSTVTVSITSSSVTVNTASLTFNSVSVPQSVSITVAYQGGGSHSVSLTINHSFSTIDPNYSAATWAGCGVNAAGVMTLPVYTTTPTISVDNQVSLSSLSTGTYQISINILPKTNNVVVSLSVGGSNVSVSPTSVTFTPTGFTSQTITVTSIVAVTGVSLTSTITHTLTSTDTVWSSYNKSPPSLQTVATVILTSFAGLTFSNTFLDIAYLESGSYTFNLKTTPAAAVTVAITSSSSNIGLSSTSFSVSTTASQTVTVTVNSAPTAVTSLDYLVTLTHTLTSTDTNYNGLIYTTIIDVINVCTPTLYDWTNLNLCTSTTISGFVTSSGSPVPCTPGSYYSSGACTTCAIGSYCPDGVNTYSCPSGFYTTATGKSYCSRVAAGYYWTSTSSAGTAVSAGSYALPGFTAATTCKAGDYCPYTTLNIEFKCPPGTYSTSTGATSCTACAEGYSCTYTSTAICSSTSMYSPLNRPECFQCSAVFTSCTLNTITLVTEGNKISSNTISTCTGSYICTIRNNFQGYYCPPGTYYNSNTCTVCSSGSSCNGATGSQSSCTSPAYNWGVVCLTCPYPSYNSGGTCTVVAAGSTWSGSALTTCASYTWSPGGYWNCIQASPGYSNSASKTSPVGTVCTTSQICPPLSSTSSTISPCPARTYNILTGLMHMSQCMICPEGYSCGSTTVANPTSSCSAPCVVTATGKFNPFAASSSDSFICLGGSYSAASNTYSSNGECLLSSLGSYAQSGSSSSATAGYFSADLLSVTGCPFGTYVSTSSATDITSCLTCTVNSYCPRQSSLPTLCLLGWQSPSSSNQECVRCAEGSVCAGSAIVTPTACKAGYFCPLGTYSESTFEMIPGFYISSTSAISEKNAVECAAGYFNAAGSTAVSTTSCSAGFYCWTGMPMINMFACPPGTYGSTGLTDSSVCSACPAGSACMTGTSTPAACNAGYYCPAGTIRPNQFPCLAGTYSASTSLTAAPCTTCDAGYYCPYGSSVEFACPQGTYAGSAGTVSISQCQSCTSGYYCGSTATVTPTNCGAGYYCNTGATAPLTCLIGYYCSTANMNYAAMIASICPAGYLCPYGASTYTSYACTAGYYCLQGALFVIPCPPGTYRATTGGASLSDCINTPAGYYLDSYASSISGVNCPAGYYCVAGTTQPTPCPAGTYNPSTKGTSSASCLTCTAGSYCPFEATVTPTACPAGSYCVAGVTSPTLCPVGTYAPLGNLVSMASCTNCDAGSYCDTAGLTAVAGTCAAGYYCYSASITATPVAQSYGYLCPAGSYCPAGCTAPVSCPNGSFNNYQGQSTSAGCITCPAGFYCASTVDPFPSGPCAPGYFCTAGQSTATPAAGQATVGYFAPGGTPAQIACPLGTYQDTVGSSSCKTCTAGSYCPSLAMSSPTICPVGYYCPSGAISPTPCIPGTFRATTGATQLSDCTLCTAGSYCGDYALNAVSGQCAAGYFCLLGSPYQYPSTLVTGTSSYGPCPAGYYCPQGTTSSTANACPQGTYNPAILGTSISACLKCTAGRYCPNTANTNDNNVCPQNYFCPESTYDYTLNPCTAGHFCATGSDYEKPCFPGYYTSTGLQSSCSNCPLGSYCPRGTSSLTSNTCPVGYYCPLNTIYNNQYPCAPGTYNPSTGSSASSACLACPATNYCDTYGIGSVTSLVCAAGFYCSGKAIVSKPMPGSGYGGVCTPGQFCPAGSSAPSPCTGGKYCAKSQLAQESGSCTAGHYCTLNATVPTPTSTLFSFGDICPSGSYCPSGTTTPIPCPAGYYMPYTGAVALTDCILCPPGYYCPVAGITFPTAYPCTGGYICSSGVINPTIQCPIGSYCPQGSWQNILCAAGTYQDTVGQTTCKSCTAGNYCELGATAQTTCPSGYYCPASTGYRYTYPCSIGTYNSLTGQSLPSSCVSCDPGMYCNDTGLSAPTGSCSAGYYCTGSAVVPNPPDYDQTGSSCTKGNYCAAGSHAQTSCTAGSYCIQQSLGAVSGQCFAGYYCVAGSITPVPIDGVSGNICALGTYCPQNSGSQTNCPAGTFGAGVGLTAQSDCTQCPYGYYCAVPGLSNPTGQCSAGSYCDGGQTAAAPAGKACTVGNYCQTGSFQPVACSIGTYQPATGQSSCLTCQQGKYCDSGVAAGTACLAGYYCPSGTRISTEFPCAAGSYSSTTGQSACTSCPAGYVCPPGTSTYSTVCPLYSYCPLGTGTAPICPQGTYNTGSTGLQSSASCTKCPAGSYCVDGRISGTCDAGYLCLSGSPTPTPIGNNTYGYQCPAGYYCTAGATVATPCLNGTFNLLVGGSSQDDCTECPPGYYCLPNVATPYACPKGYYCPQGVKAAIACPARTYNPLTTQDSENSCVVCPGGYMCTDTGVSDYTLYPCNTIGAYCVVGAQTATPCPPGTYSNSTTAASISDCITCPAGSWCPGGSNSVIKCSEGTYCPSGSAYWKLCLVGHYCPPGTGSSILCPVGYYCPKYDTNNLPNYVLHPELYYSTTHLPHQYYLPCPTGYVCPLGSFAPTFCQPGYQAKNNQCVACSAGNYSDSTLGCLQCDPGYICVYAATRPDPEYLSYQGGYICPAGYYCPAGATSPIACPPGTYNALEGQSSNAVCQPCPVNTFTDSYGNPSCFPCGSSAYAVTGQTTCNCTGAFRSYLKSDGTCRCFPGYQFLYNGAYVSDQDGAQDCFQIVLPNQPEGYIRKPDGTCVAATGSCAGECNGGTGTRMPGNGNCLCDNVKSIENVCNPNCRTNSDQIVISGNNLTHVNSGTSVNLASLTQYYGKTSCTTGTTCKSYSICMTPNGPTAMYGVCPVVYSALGMNSTHRRLTTTSASITNPVFCISIGESFIFTVSKTNYPVYLKNSLLNTNSNFDYGAFSELDSLMASGQSNITIFAYTFTAQGIYDFADSADSEKHIIVSVVGQGQQCPDSDIPIRTRTESSILTLGAQTNKNIITDPDWVFISTTILWLMLAVILIILGVYYFENKEWIYKYRVKSDFRARQTHIDVEGLTRPENDSSSFDESDKDKSEHKDPEPGMEELMGNDDIDPTIFQSMLKLLQDQDALAKNTFLKRSEDGQENMRTMLEKLNNLKKFLRDSLEGLNEKDSDSESEAGNIEISPDQEIEKALVGIADTFARDASRFDDAKQKLMEMLNDPNLSEKDKRALLEDFNANIDRIDQALGDEQRKAQEILSKRLLDRQNKKKQKKPTGEPIVEEPEKPSFMQKLLRQNTDKEIQNIDQEKQVIEKQIEEEKSDIIKKMREELAANLKNAKDKREKEELMEDYNKRAKELELRMLESKEKQEAELMRRLQNRKNKKPIEIQDPVPELLPGAPTFFKVEDQEKIEVVQEKLEEERQKLYEQQEAEKIKLEEEIEKAEIIVPIPKPEERSKLEQALKSATSDAERKELLSQLNQFDERLAASSLSQQSQLEAKLLERKRLRALKEAELKKKHLQEQSKLDDKEDQEIANLTDNITKQRIEDLMHSDLNPEEIVKKIKEMIDEKHEIELGQLVSKKQEILAERQTYLLQESLAVKAAEIQKTRKEFFGKRNETEISALHPNSKLVELQNLEKKESETMTQIDYNFINNLSKAQDDMWRGVEDEFRQRFLDLADKHLQETADILQKMRAANPALLESHLKQAQDEAKLLKNQVEDDYKNKVKELDARQREIMMMQGEKEKEIEELKRQLDEADAKKRELFEVERMRKEMEEKQKKMIEEMRKRGIKPEQMEEMIKKHQQEMSEWEATMEKERIRQKERMQAKLDARIAKQQDRMALKIARYKEENLKLAQAKEDEKLELKFNAGRPDLLFEPIKDIDSRLRVNPLPIFVRNPITEYADYSNLLQNLLIRVKKIEKTVASVDLDQFESIMKQLENISENVSKIKGKN